MSSSDSPFSDTDRELYSAVFPPSVKSPASSKPLFLLGGGVKGFNIEGRFEIFTVIGVYLDISVAVPSLSVNWKGKTAEELTDSDPFFCEIITGPFEKFIKVFNKLPLDGQQMEKLTENSVAKWISLGIYTEAEAKAVDRFLEVFKDPINFSPNYSILFALSPNSSSLTVAFSNDNSIPETGLAEIENKLLAEAVLESFIGKNSLYPVARLSLAKRLDKLMNKKNTVEEDATRTTDLEEANDLSLGDNLAKEN